MRQSIFIILIAMAMVSCTRRLPEAVNAGGSPRIFPDYTGVTVPPNIAPLNFKIEEANPAFALFSFNGERLVVKGKKGSFDIPLKDWRYLLHSAAGSRIQAVVYEKKPDGWHRYDPFPIHVAEEKIDPYLAYRRIAPGYRLWNEMGIYQRNLEDFTEETILSNKSTNNNCMNCHSFCMQDPARMVFHQRSSHAGTYLVEGNSIRKLHPESMREGQSMVYPFWHPSGRFIAFSGNDTKQDFHLTSPNRVEVFDLSSDIYIYDLETNNFITSPFLSSKENMETFPAFSPDGKTLYFCSAGAKQMPESYEEVKYNLVAISFDPEKKCFGTQTDTLYNADREGRSAKFPRVSPDGRYLMYTLSDYGNFSIWHKDADLRLADLETLATDTMRAANSPDADSYHSWSSNSRWFVFSSRRQDGLYTRPYICYISKDGTVAKPFLLPQKDTGYYTNSLFSFNIPELVKGKVNVSTHDLIRYSLSQDTYQPSTTYSAGE